MSFQLPLSGSLHRPAIPLCRRATRLSTPSLGITCRAGQMVCGRLRSAFNSLSRDHKGVRPLPWVPSASFQLPLSGSPDRLLDDVLCHRKDLSTPSLGITYGSGFVGQLAYLGLSTPSLGITDCSMFITDPSGSPALSTPSLGITEPDSGIFRLSAAFCRGTLSHK